MNRARFSFTLAVFCLQTSVLCLAQSRQGAVTGVVTDPTGAGVPAASIQVINKATGITTKTVTTDTGAYRVVAARYRASSGVAAGFQRGRFLAGSRGAPNRGVLTSPLEPPERRSTSYGRESAVCRLTAPRGPSCYLPPSARRWPAL